MKSVTIILIILLTCGIAFGEVSVKDRMVELAKEDLAKLLSVDSSEIKVKSVEEVIWVNGALGYPEEGHYYTEALVEGYRVILSYKGRHYEYHTDMRDHAKLDPKVKEEFK